MRKKKTNIQIPLTDVMEEREKSFNEMKERVNHKMDGLIVEYSKESGKHFGNIGFLTGFISFLEKKKEESKRIFEEAKEQNKSTDYSDEEAMKLLELHSDVAGYDFLKYFAQTAFKEGSKNATVKGKYKRAGHLTDQMLKVTVQKDANSQNSIFDSLEESTKKNILDIVGVEVTHIVEGIKLSPSEVKLTDCFSKLLHERSQTSEPDKESYYSGNLNYELVKFGDDDSTPAPKLAFTLYELTQEYKGSKTISGKDVDNVKMILNELANKRFLLSYVETTMKKDGSRIERKIEDFQKLIHIVNISKTEYSKEDVELSKKEETVVILSPIFRRQIDSKFILYPNDITRRTIIAYGSSNLSDAALRLRDYLLREFSSKRYEPEINLDKLYLTLCEKWMNESRKKKVKQYTEKAIETVKALGLLSKHEIVPDSKGNSKVIFFLNKDWE